MFQSYFLWYSQRIVKILTKTVSKLEKANNVIIQLIADNQRSIEAIEEANYKLRQQHGTNKRITNQIQKMLD